jgi:hypothetical protein
MDPNDQEIVETRNRGRAGKLAMGGGILAAGALAGAILAGTVSASADTTPTPSASSSASTGTSAGSAATGQSGQQGQLPAGPADNSSTPVRSDEKAVSADIAAKLKAAALTAVPGGTVIRVETDAGDAVYEAHMTKADGTRVTVKFDKDLAVTAVEDGMGKGDPAPAGGTGQRSAGGSGTAPGAPSSGSSSSSASPSA